MESNREQQITNTKNRTIVRPTTHGLIYYSTWQEWTEGFQTFEELASVGITPEDELKLKQLLSDEGADGE